MSKDFDSWNEIKKTLQTEKKPLNFQTRQVWWCAIGINLGFEQDGKSEKFERPVLILRKFNKELFYGIPLSTQLKKGEFYYSMPDWNGQKGQALLSQVRVMSSKRLLRYMYRTSENIVSEINKEIYELLSKKRNP